MNIKTILPTLTGAAILASVASAQEQDPTTIEELRRRIELLEREQTYEVEDLRVELEDLQRKLAEMQSRGQAANVFNPAITIFGNFIGRWDDRNVYLEDDPAEERIDDQFNLREVEVDFRAAIDPWADGVLIAALESEVPGEYETEVEEGYVTLKKLPVLDSAPGGLKLKAGRFRPSFGRFNKIHLHDLPQTTYPRSLETFLGEEGYIREGLSSQFFLPAPTDSQSIEVTFEVVNGGDIPVAEDEAASNLATLGNVRWFADLGEGTNVELGVTGWQTDSDHRLYGADATFKWKPYEAGEWRSFLVGGELYQADLDEAGLDDDPMGFYVWSQYQFNRNVYFGVRFDCTEELDDADRETETYGAYLTYYTTEFLRLRLGGEHVESDIDLIDERDTLFLELNFVFGSHPVEPYWVNR